ncbi:MAG TPA: hypothetical protein VGW40_07865 [Allosphingosinicella sp.]|nr:hypothetical protein [Allosphingosinicella sp.]
MNYDYDASYLDSADTEAWPVEDESADYADFSDYSDYAGDYSEARGRRKPVPRPVKGASGAPVFRKRPAPGAASNSVTQAQLEAALARVRQQITANATAIKTIDGRVRTVIADTQKLQAQTRKTVDKLRSDLRTTQTLSALIPLLTANNAKLASIAPLAHLVMGSEGFPGGQSAGQSGSGGPLGNTNNLITIGALAFASGIFDK